MLTHDYITDDLKMDYITDDLKMCATCTVNTLHSQYTTQSIYTPLWIVKEGHEAKHIAVLQISVA